MQVRRVAVAGVADVAYELALLNALTLGQKGCKLHHMAVYIAKPVLVTYHNIVAGNIVVRHPYHRTFRAGGYVRTLSCAYVRAGMPARGLGPIMEPAVLNVPLWQRVQYGGNVFVAKLIAAIVIRKLAVFVIGRVKVAEK